MFACENIFKCNLTTVLSPSPGPYVYFSIITEIIQPSPIKPTISFHYGTCGIMLAKRVSALRVHQLPITDVLPIGNWRTIYKGAMSKPVLPT